jgi:hypothetical protein
MISKEAVVAYSNYHTGICWPYSKKYENLKSEYPVSR